MTSFLQAALVAFGTAAILTPILRGHAQRRGKLDIPNERSSHTRPTPRNGGFAIMAAVLVASATAGLRDDALLIAGAACAALVVLGALDERLALPTLMRLSVQTALAASLVFTGAAALEVLPWPQWLPSSTIVLGVLSVFWLVGLLNAYNFMDGINGIASVEAIVAGAALAILSIGASDPSGALLAVAIAGAAAGFLPWNLTGSIFMGDTGSAPLGFLLGSLAARATQNGVPWIAAILPFLPFLLDTSITLLRRAWRRENVLSAHRTHYYQRLQQSGLSHAAVTSVWGALAVLSSAAAVLLCSSARPSPWLVLPTALVPHAVVFAAIDWRWSKLQGRSPR